MLGLQATPVKTFRVLTDLVTKINGIQCYSEEEREKIALALWENWNSWENPNQNSNPELVDSSLEPKVKIQTFMNTLALLDFKEMFTTMLLEQQHSPLDDFDYFLSEILPKSKLNSNQAFVFRMIGLNLFQLGMAYYEIANLEVSLKMELLGIALVERLVRMTSRTETDDLIIYSMYSHAIDVSFEVDRLETTLEIGTKLSHKFEIVFSKNKKSGFESFDSKHYLRNLLLLAYVSNRLLQPSTSQYAYEQIVQLFSTQKNNELLEFVYNTDDVLIATELTKIPRHQDKEGMLLYFSRKLIDSNEECKGDPLISLNNSRAALEFFSLSKTTKYLDLKECELQFLLGRSIYKYAIALAGGTQNASSPPIAVLSPSENQPSIKNLLEESLDVLEEASKSSMPDESNPVGKEAIMVQIAIVCTELRMEQRAAKILLDQKIDKNYISEWMQAREWKIEASRYRKMIHVFATPEVLKRLSVSQTSNGRRLTLSRSRISFFDQSTKVPCSYCSMLCNTDIQCKHCAEAKVFVRYCTEDCKNDHASQHESHCYKNKGGGAGIDIRSLLMF